MYVVCVVCVMQDWLSASARKVSLAGRPMEWVTPLGLPVVQPYHKIYHKSVCPFTYRTISIKVPFIACVYVYAFFCTCSHTA